MIYLGFLLHIYQPPNQFETVLRQIADECYRPLLRLFLSRPEALVTMNINWSLTEQLMHKGSQDVLDDLKILLQRGQVELTGTAAYHAILPLIPKEERSRQVLLNWERHRQLWNSLYQPKGFFPPEMAFGPEVVELLKELHYAWTIAEDIPFLCLHKEVPKDYIATVDGLPVFLRSNFWSNKISMQKDAQGNNFKGNDIARWLVDDLQGWFGGKDGYVIIAMDGETFGHHHKAYVENFWKPFLDALAQLQDKIQLVHISKLLELFPTKAMDVPPGSWSTREEDFWEGNFFPLWKGKYNQAHQLLWELTELAVEAVNKLQERLDKSLNSCTFWWAATQPEKASPITYSGIDMILEVINKANPAKAQEAEALKSRLFELLKL